MVWHLSLGIKGIKSHISALHGATHYSVEKETWILEFKSPSVMQV